MLQIIFAIIALLILALVTFLLYRRRKNERADAAIIDKLSLESLGEIVAKELAELVRDDDTIIAKDVKFQGIMKNKRRLDNAMTGSVAGISTDVKVMKAQIRTVLEKLLLTIEDVYEIIDFTEPILLDNYIKWEMLLYYTCKTHKKDCIHYLASKYDWEQEVELEENGIDTLRRILTADDLDYVFFQEMDGREVTYEEALDIVSIAIFTQRWGLGVIDTLRSLDIDGMNFGTSGSIRYAIDGNMNAKYTDVNSIWVQINAKWIHFSFLSFNSVNEMKRVVNQVMSWGSQAPMTEKNPKKVNDMADGSRCTAVRPPSGESWACFIRKFSPGIYQMQKLLNKPEVHNWELCARLIYYLMKAEQTTAFTGPQNTGKTSLMKAAIEYTDYVNIRVLEMSFELALRELYPYRNVITVKPTDYVSSSELQDLLKKTDGYLSMVGEVAEDIVAARMIQFCLIASAFTIFSHHGKDDFGLINGLANSLVASGEYGNHEIATSTVLDAVKNNVHLDFCDNIRVISYISEIVKESELEPYPEIKRSKNTAEAVDQLTMIVREQATRTTDRVKFTSRKIIKFNSETMTYEPCERYTPERLAQICNKLRPDDRREFIEWYTKNWGIA